MLDKTTLCSLSSVEDILELERGTEIRLPIRLPYIQSARVCSNGDCAYSNAFNGELKCTIENKVETRQPRKAGKFVGPPAVRCTTPHPYDEHKRLRHRFLICLADQRIIDDFDATNVMPEHVAHLIYDGATTISAYRSTARRREQIREARAARAAAGKPDKSSYPTRMGYARKPK